MEYLDIIEKMVKNPFIKDVDYLNSNKNVFKAYNFASNQELRSEIAGKVCFPDMSHVTVIPS